jgi:carbamoyl-phosphate synthase large subunit
LSKISKMDLLGKRAFDIAFASLAVVILSPFLAAIALSIRCTMGMPIFFRQARPGKDETPFTILKFRSMTMDSAEGRLLPDGMRITRWGKLLRSTSLDELPELFNVIRGDMSLVGPRPLLMEYLPLYSPEQHRRHRVRPGITGWAQIHGRNTLSWEEKFLLDNWYIDNWSFWLDLKILAKTVMVVLFRIGISARDHATMPKFGENKPRPAMKSSLTLLLSSAGRRVALLECFRADAAALGLNLRVIATDMKPDLSAACAAADAAFRAPVCSSPEYPAFLRDLCAREKVDLLVPTIDAELPIVAMMAEELSQFGTRAVVSSTSAVAVARDKLKTAVELDRKGVKTPRTVRLADFDSMDDHWIWPLIIKPVGGSSSIGLRVVEKEEFLADRPAGDMVVQERLIGDEYTVNIFFDREGGFRCAIPHLRIATRAGEVSKGRTVRLEALKDMAQRVAEILPGARGPLCFQAIVNAEGVPSLFEINARFGGGFPLAHKAGAHFTRWLLEEAAGLPLSANDHWRSDVQMLRYDAAIFL